MKLSDYARAYDRSGEPPTKTRIFFTTCERGGARCNAVGGRFGYGVSFPVVRRGETFDVVTRDWRCGGVMRTGETYTQTLRGQALILDGHWAHVEGEIDRQFHYEVKGG